jgi:hypothetical protein
MDSFLSPQILCKEACLSKKGTHEGPLVMKKTKEDKKCGT